MSPSPKAKITLVLALFLLSLTGVAAGVIIFRLYRAQSSVRHTYDVEVAIGDLESSLTQAGQSRVVYVNSPTPESLSGFWEALNNVASALARIRRLTSDNPSQRGLVDHLESDLNLWIASCKQLVELKRRNQYTPVRELQLNSEVAGTAFDIARITEQMKRNEKTLLEQRTVRSRALFTAIVGVLAISFVLSAFMFWLHYHLLRREFRERREAENQLRELSVQLMRVQDEEHRRFARELHDGVGQTLAAAKMMLPHSPPAHSDAPWAAELSILLNDAISQTRTMSYLFHPPLLDEIGFSSAAKWLIDGYAQRTGLNVHANIPQPGARLPRSLELTLYRVLQEALNNIHRHSDSSRAEVSLQIDSNSVTLRVKDFGKGIASDTLAALQTNATQAGVGLLGMKERVREQSGELKIGSHAMGTEIVVKIPYSPRVEAHNTVAAPQ